MSRRFHAYGVGLGKSGTHSLTGIFSKYRCAHEPESEFMLGLVLKFNKGSVNKEEAAKELKEQDKRLMLEFNSSTLNRFVLDILVKEFPDAKFILTIRDCFSWVSSYINHLLSHRTTGQWEKLRGLSIKPGHLEHQMEEKVLAEYGLPNLDHFFSYWAQENKKVIQTVPGSRLLMIRTQDLSKGLNRISDFLGIPLNTLDSNRSHQYKAKDKYDILQKIDRDFIRSRAVLYCSELMEKYFPEVEY